MQKNWRIINTDERIVSTLIKGLDLTKIFAKILVNRGIKNVNQAKHFLDANLESGLHDPMHLPDMKKSVARIKKAIDKKENILIFSDYDVDGVTSCAVLKSAFLKLGINPKTMFPHRLKEGYGINKNAIDFARQEKIDLFISLDSGTTNHKEIKALNNFGIDVIVVDHHHVGEELPSVVGLINPKRKDNTYPYLDLASVGLTYKLAQALLGSHLEEELDLVCLGTIADVVPLDGENRIFVKYGLKYLSETKRPGLKALIELASLKEKNITSRHVSYIIAPRLNASGRIASADISLELLLTKSKEKAVELAKKLNEYNKERRAIEEQILGEAICCVEKEINFKEHRVIVLAKDNWHQGVLGIIASRLVDRFYRPAVVISFEGNLGKGSARSIKNFHILDAISQCDEFLEGFGGHRYAAGVTILRNNIDYFRDHFNKIAQDSLLEEDLYPLLEIDAEIDLSKLSISLIKNIETLAPFGANNSVPLLCSRNLKMRGKPMKMSRDTLKFWVTDGKHTYQALGFGMAQYQNTLEELDSFDLAYTLGLDDWQGHASLQLEIKDIKPS